MRVNEKALACGAGIAITLSLAAVGGVTMATPDSSPDALVDHVEFMTAGSGVWITSNEDYQTVANGEPPAYGMSYDRSIWPGAATGCQWSAFEDAQNRMDWGFLIGWDVERDAAFLSQFSPGGILSSGLMESIAGAHTKITQTILLLDGTSWSIRHETRSEGRDVFITQSFNQADGEWVPHRTYRWIRQSDVSQNPC